MIIIELKPHLKLAKTILLPSLVMALLLIITGQLLKPHSRPLVMGAFLTQEPQSSVSATSPVFGFSKPAPQERFFRPSKSPSLGTNLSFKFHVFDDPKATVIPDNIPKVFSTPEDALQGYFAILKNASNMGTATNNQEAIGMGTYPYPYAYNILAPSTQKLISLNQFKESFIGIGHLSLLKLLPLSTAGLPNNLKAFMVEIEVLREIVQDNNTGLSSAPTYFNYYYGVFLTEQVPNQGWKIYSMYYIPEKFLTQQDNYWTWNGENVVKVLYGKEYGLIKKINKVQEKNGYVEVFASSDKNSYKFEFVRLTNGEDILLKEYIKKGFHWQEKNLLKPEHARLKFTPMNFFQ